MRCQDVTHPCCHLPGWASRGDTAPQSTAAVPMLGPLASLHPWQGHSHQPTGISSMFEPGIGDTACAPSQVPVPGPGTSPGSPTSQPHWVPVVTPHCSMGSVMGGLSHPEG